MSKRIREDKEPPPPLVLMLEESSGDEAQDVNAMDVQLIEIESSSDEETVELPRPIKRLRRAEEQEEALGPTSKTIFIPQKELKPSVVLDLSMEPLSPPQQAQELPPTLPDSPARFEIPDSEEHRLGVEVRILRNIVWQVLIGPMPESISPTLQTLPTLARLLQVHLSQMNKWDLVRLMIECVAFLNVQGLKNRQRYAARLLLPSDAPDRIQERMEYLRMDGPLVETNLLVPQLDPMHMTEGEAEKLPHVRQIICSVYPLPPEKQFAYHRAIADALGINNNWQYWVPLIRREFHTMIHNRWSAFEKCRVVHELLAWALHQQRPLMIAHLLAASPDDMLIDILISYDWPLLEQILQSTSSSSVLYESSQAQDVAILRLLQLKQTAANLAPFRLAVREMFYKKRRGQRKFHKLLYPYQQMAIQWLVERCARPARSATRMCGGVLCARPGMGKTRILLMTLRYLFANKRPGALGTHGSVAVVLVPVNTFRDILLENKKTSQLKIQLLHNDSVTAELFDETEDQETFVGNADPTPVELKTWFNDGPDAVQVILSTATTFLDRFSRDSNFYQALRPRFRILVIDEVHQFRNAGTQVYRDFQSKLDGVADIRIGLTGTPFVNTPSDLANQIGLLAPQWYYDLAHGVSSNEAGRSWIILEQFLILNYGPETIELPEFEDSTIHVPLYAVDRQIYDYVANANAGVMRYRQAAIGSMLLEPNSLDELHVKYVKRHDALNKKWQEAEDKRLALVEQLNLEGEDYAERMRLYALEQEQYYREYSSIQHTQSLGDTVRSLFGGWFGFGAGATTTTAQTPQQILVEPRAPKAPRQVKIPAAEPKPQVVDPNRPLRPNEYRTVDEEGKPIIMEDPTEHYASAKFVKMVELLREILLNPYALDNKVLVFCSFIRGVEEALYFAKQDEDLRSVTDMYMFTGEQTALQKNEIRHLANRSKNLRLLFLTPQSGGTGLNLQSFNYLISLDPAGFTHALREQMIARAHRVGQKQHVTQYTLLSPDTYEERMLIIQAEKQSMAEEVFEEAPDAVDRRIEEKDEELMSKIRALRL